MMSSSGSTPMALNNRMTADRTTVAMKPAITPFQLFGMIRLLALPSPDTLPPKSAGWNCGPLSQVLDDLQRGIFAMQSDQPSWHGTTILTVRKGGLVAIGGDGQVSIGQTIVKANAKKVRRLGKGDVIGGFAGATADAFTLFERLEAKLEQYPGQLTRAAVELAKDWRTDRYLRRLEAMMIVADKDVSLVP